MKHLSKLAALFAITTSLAACGEQLNSENGGSTTLPTNNGEVVRLEAGMDLTPPQPAEDYTVGVLFPFLASPFWVNEAYGVIDQADRAGVDLVWLSADGYGNIDRQNNQIDDLVARDVDAILLAATSFSGTAAAVDRATAAGVPVFAHVTSSDTENIISAVLDDDVEIGRKQARFIGERLGSGRVAMLNGPSGAEWSMRRVRGFKEVISENYPGIEIVAERFGSPDRSDALRQTEDLLTQFEDLDAIFTVADGMAMGAADAATNAGRINDVMITTASFSRESLPYIRSGAIDLNIDENPVVIGRVAINTIISALNGDSPPATIYVPNPEYTAENLDSVDAQRQWAPTEWRLR